MINMALKTLRGKTITNQGDKKKRPRNIRSKLIPNKILRIKEKSLLTLIAVMSAVENPVIKMIKLIGISVL